MTSNVDNNLISNSSERRQRLSESDTYIGIDYVEATDINRFVIHFVPTKNKKAEDNKLSVVDKNWVTLDGPVIPVIEKKPSWKSENPDQLEVTIEWPQEHEPNPFHKYKCILQRPDSTDKDKDKETEGDTVDVDPVFDSAEFRFDIKNQDKQTSLSTNIDCQKPRSFAESPREIPVDYLAKDYASFRSALVDLIPTLAPQWEERLEADLGITLIELLAYVADNLSYYQDAVANEAWLETARQRISVRRHARLLDYKMHDGISAATVVQLKVRSQDKPCGKSNETTKSTFKLPPGTQFISRFSDTNLPVLIPEEQREEAFEKTEVVFETIQETHLWEELNELAVYTWSESHSSLPKGATHLYVKGDISKILANKNFNKLLLISESNNSDTDQPQRQLVRVLVEECKKIIDPFPDPSAINKNFDGTVTKIKWDERDALKTPFCISAGTKSACVYGNLAIVDHGKTLTEEAELKRPSSHQNQRRALRVRLKEGPLSFGDPLINSCNKRSIFPGEPEFAEPRVAVSMSFGSSNEKSVEWEARKDLLSSLPHDRHFTVETDNFGRALLRFGDGTYGMAPPAKKINITYRVGVGASGNIGADSIGHVLKPAKEQSKWPKIISVTNPLPASGGIDPEPIERVKRLAPAQFRASPRRAVTVEDYSRLAKEHPKVTKAVASVRWTGSWHTVFVTIDLKAGLDFDTEKPGIEQYIQQYALVGYDVSITAPKLVPVDIGLIVQLNPNAFKGAVEKQIRARLSNQILPDGTRGFFHPDNFTFGQPLYLSRLIETVEGVSGVRAVKVNQFTRCADQEKENVTKFNRELGYVSVNSLEIIQLDNDPAIKENGVLKLKMEGGR